MPELIEQLAGFRAPTGVLDGDGTGQAPTDAELERHVVAPGSDALLPCGIEYQAGWDILEDGLARHARAQVKALARTGLPVTLRRLQRPKYMMEDDVDPQIRATVGYLRDTSLGAVPIAIRQLVVHNASYLEQVIVPAGARWSGFADEIKVYESTIVYTPWERTTVSPEIANVLNRCAEVWVHGEWAVDIFRRAGVRKVYAIPAPYDPDTNLACRVSAPRGPETVPEGRRFYAIGKWEPRKNYHRLLTAFLLEFSPQERASLFIKTYEWGEWEGYPTVEESIRQLLAKGAVRAKGWTPGNFSKRVRVLSKKLPEEKIAHLHRDNNIYVSCSHAEGWDLPAFDARCAGNRMVYTGWSGPAGFAGADDVSICQTDTPNVSFEPVHPGYGWEKDALWAESPLLLIRAALRRAQPPKRRVHPADFYAKYGLGPVGNMMAARIATRFPDAYKKLVEAGGFG
jgi:glycosyltransferase involved in cell wall biosynthesis